MSKHIRTLKLLLRRYKNAKIIRKFDSECDELHPLDDGDRLEKGFMRDSIDNFLECWGLSERLQNSYLRRAPEDGKNSYFSWELPDYLWDALLTSKKLSTAVKNYLGPHARLDDLYVKTVSDGLDSASESWHDDNVGYRLKLFMVFDTEGTPSGTYIVPRNRPNIYNVQLVDEVARALGTKKNENRPSSEHLTYAAGDCLLFDTNLEHRGDYSTASGIRYCIVAEFIDRRKGNRLKGKAPCGPGQGRKKIPIPLHVFDKIDSCSLIDQNLITKTETSLEYGY